MKTEVSEIISLLWPIPHPELLVLVIVKLLFVIDTSGPLVVLDQVMVLFDFSVETTPTFPSESFEKKISSPSSKDEAESNTISSDGF